MKCKNMGYHPVKDEQTPVSKTIKFARLIFYFLLFFLTTSYFLVFLYWNKKIKNIVLF